METHHTPGHAAAHRLVPLAALLILMAVAALGFVSVTLFNAAVQPELDNRSRLIGTVIRNNIERALELGVPLGEITGIESYLQHVMDAFPEVSHIRLKSVEGVTLVSVGHEPDTIASLPAKALQAAEARSPIPTPQIDTVQFAILSGNTMAGSIGIGINQAYVEQQFTDVFLDVLVVILVILLLAFEVTLAAVTASLSKPLDGLCYLLERQAIGNFSQILKLKARGALGQAAARFSDHAIDLNTRYARHHATCTSVPSPTRKSQLLGRIGQQHQLSAKPPIPIATQDTVDMRLPLFLFATGEELSKSFLPLLVRSVATPDAWLSPDLLISLPLIAYLLALIVLSPLAGHLVTRHTARTVFIVSLIPVGLSHIGLSLSHSVFEFVLWRGVAGAGYALATIACQEYALRTCDPRQQGRATGAFVMVVIGGTFCGTALGGVLADRIGTSLTFVTGAVLVTVSGILALRMMGKVSDERPTAQAAGAHGRSAFSNVRFIGLLAGVSIPANIMMAAFLWYLVPLTLADLGARPADIGRALMLYYLITILIAPIAARLADSTGGAIALLLAGGMLSGLGLISLGRWYGFWPIISAIIATGIGHAMIRASQTPHALQIARAPTSRTTPARTLNALRMWERIGSAIGLALTGMLVGQLGYAPTINLIGLFTLGSAVAFLCVELCIHWLPNP